MSAWSGRSKGGALGYRFFIFLIRTTPLPVSYAFARMVAIYYLIFSDLRPSRYYFRNIHAQGSWKALWNTYRRYGMLGEVLIDKVAHLSGIRHTFDFTYEGEEHLLRMSEEGRGGLLLGAHMGNWEVAGQLLERIHTPVHILMLEAERASISRLLEKTMTGRRFNIISQKDDYSHLYQIKEVLERGEFVVMHGDRYLPGAKVLEMPFMGRKAFFPSGPLYLASKYGVPVSFVFTLKEGRGYHFHASAPRRYAYPSRLPSRQEELSAMLADYLRDLERMVQRYPLQWFNFYPFWKEEQTQPNHESR